jgi:adenine/guanine phosphoribosyltransferase-like PRPP-binding protein
MKIETVAALIATAGALGAALNHFNSLKKRRSRLKEDFYLDLQILEKYPDNIDGKKLIKKRIIEKVHLLYSDEDPEVSFLESQHVLSFFVFAIFAFFTWYFSRNGFSGWSIVVGIVAVVILVSTFVAMAKDNPIIMAKIEKDLKATEMAKQQLEGEGLTPPADTLPGHSDPP